MSYAGSLESYVKEHRFKKGHSGNPRSRPKGAKSRVYFKKTEFRHRTGSRQCAAAIPRTPTCGMPTGTGWSANGEWCGQCLNA